MRALHGVVLALIVANIEIPAQLQILPQSSQFLLQSPAVPFEARRSPVLNYVSNSRLLLFGGRSGNSCLTDAWTSLGADDDPWVLIPPGTQSRPSGASAAPVAVDGSGCLWLLGGECNDRIDGFWKTCDAGISWTQVARPTVVPFASVLPVLPAEFVGHSIAIVGDWQLVIVDAANHANGGVWRFLDREAQYAQKVVVAPLPFGQRRSPHLLATSAGELFLLGGDLCDGFACTNAVAFNDVWKSLDIGSSWALQSAHYTPHSLFAGPVVNVAAAIAKDDTMFLVGGIIANSTTAFNTTFFSRSGDADTEFRSSPVLWVERSALSFTLCFLEGVQIGEGLIQMWDYGSDNQQGGDVPDSSVNITVNISQQTLTITADKMESSFRHQIIVPAGSVRDLAGNALPAAIEYFFFPDNLGPKVQYATPAGANVAPWSSIALTMNEDVIAGSGNLLIQPAVGTEISLDVRSSVIVDKRVLFEVPAGVLFTEGQEYTMTVPHGFLRDSHNNDMDAGTVGTFLVFSGQYSANNYMGGLDAIALAAPTLAGISQVPTLVSTYPQNGATDVPVDFGISLVLYYSGPVQLNSNSVINFLNAVGHVVVSRQTSVQARTVAAHNAVVVDVPLFQAGMTEPLLKRGALVTVSIPVGVVQSLSNDSLPELSINFTCLAGQIDVAPPQVITSEATYLNTSAASAEFNVYFTEAIQAASGNLVLTRPEHVGGSLGFSLSDSAVVITGSKLSLMVPNGIMPANGEYTLSIPAGCIKDLERTFPGRKGTFGGNELGQERNFTLSVHVDTEGPLLDVLSTQPLLEVPPLVAQTQWPPSLGLLLSFNEAVQAHEGNVILTPAGSSSSIVTLPASSAAVSGRGVFLSPPVDLSPGERYRLTIEPGSFADVHSNPFQGLLQDYFFSTAAEIIFEQLGSSQFVGSTSATGKRFSSGIAVDANNTIYVIGGANGSEAMLDDYWKLETLLPIDCASAWKPRGQCNSSACFSKAGTNILGSAVTDKVIWRTSSNGGSNCTSTAGLTQIGDIIARSEVDCPCPLCATPPEEPLPANMSNTASHSLVEAGSTYPLQCQTGYNASGEFVCVASNDLLAAFQQPYPKCEPLNCTSPPNTSAVAHFAQFNVQNSTSGVDCAAISDHAYMVHGGTCAIECEPGWLVEKSIRCEYGVFQAGECSRQSCPPISLSNGVVSCGDNHNSEPEPEATLPVQSNVGQIGDTCNVTCFAGFQALAFQVSCQTEANASAQATPAFVPTPVCNPSSCGDFPSTYLQDAGVTYATINYGGSSKVMGDVVLATCAQGSQPTSHTGLVLLCDSVSSLAGNSEVVWKSNVSGEVAGPPCIEDGYDSVVQYVVKTVLQGDLELPANVSMQDLCTNVSFFQDTAIALAESLRFIGADVPDGNVSDVAYSHCSSSVRLLSESHDDMRRRRMEASRIEYTVHAGSEAASVAVQNALALQDAQPTFAYRFYNNLLQRTGIGVTSQGPTTLQILQNQAQVLFVKVLLPTTTGMATTTAAVVQASSDDGSDISKVLLAILVGIVTTTIFIGALYLRVKRIMAEDAEAYAKAVEDAQHEEDVRAYRESHQKANEGKNRKRRPRSPRLGTPGSRPVTGSSASPMPLNSTLYREMPLNSTMNSERLVAD